jgi:hypothetical protein
MYKDIIDIIIKMVAAAIARSRSPQDIFRYRDMGRVSVFIRVAPATIRAAPNSPIPFDHVITPPARRPFFDIGSVVRKNACIGLQPSVWATYSYLGLIPSNVERIIRSINDIFTANCAMIIPSGVNTNFSPMSASQFPNGVVPKSSRSPTPATRGGNASGISTIVLINVFPGKLYRASAYDAGMETMMHINVEITEVSKLNLIANRISLDAILVNKICWFVCVTIHMISDRIKRVSNNVIEIVNILNVDSLTKIYSPLNARGV